MRLIGAVLAVHAQMQVAAPRAVRLLVQAEVRQFVGEYDVDVGVHKHLVDLIRLQLPVSDIGDCLDVVAEILAHLLRHIDAILLLHDEADAAAPRLTVDADHVAVIGAPDVLRIDIEIRQAPVLRMLLRPVVHPLRDSILM